MDKNNLVQFNAKLKVLLLLIMLYFTINLIGAPMAYKIIKIGPLIGPGGLVVLPFIFLIEDIIVELYGYQISRFLLLLMLASTLLFSMACVWITHLPSPSYWHLQKAYDTVFNPIIISGPSAILAIFIGRFINIILMSKWGIMLRGKHFWSRSVLSTLAGSLLALSVFFLLSFLGTVPFSVIERLFLSDITIRLSYAIIGGIPVALLVSYLKRKFRINPFDDYINFNPFSLDN